MDDVPDSPRDEQFGSSVSVRSLGEDIADESEAGSIGSAAKLLIWLSPAFPIGSFAFSHGLEWAVQAGHVHNAATAIAWLEGLLEHGAPRNDAVFAASSWRETKARHADALHDANELALAFVGSKERHLETTVQGNAFVGIVRQAWHVSEFDWAMACIKGDIAYPIAFGLVSAAHGIPLKGMLRSFTLAQIQNLVSAVIRLGVIGHTDGQRTIAALLPAIGRLALFAETATLDDIGGAAFQSDIAALRHETQYSRLFRS